MKYVQINTYSGGSTGSIMMKLHRELLGRGNESYVAWARGRDTIGDHEIKIGNMLDVYVHGIYVRLTGRMGFASKRSTAALLKRLDQIDPDVVHLHNIHGYYISIEMLFDWLAKHHCQVKWTLHDCWAFTGHCVYFTYAKCSQWKTHCAYEKPCPQLNTYPKTISKTNCERNFEDKRRIFTSIPTNRMTLIAPSHWLEGLVKQSFLKEYPLEVRLNTIDTSIFRPTPSDFRERYGIGDRFMILGVASPWTERKGLETFLRLANDLDDNFSVVLVGLSKKQIKAMPSSVVALERADSRELASIYTTADVLLNPTREDNYPTVNLEAQACGTRVITYDVGGCAETLQDERSYIVSNYFEVIQALTRLRDVVHCE